VLVKLIVAQLLNKFQPSDGTPKFITVITVSAS
jgi:hypothetical protein